MLVTGCPLSLPARVSGARDRKMIKEIGNKVFIEKKKKDGRKSRCYHLLRLLTNFRAENAAQAATGSILRPT